jgi:hypothetical protein
MCGTGEVLKSTQVEKCISSSSEEGLVCEFDSDSSREDKDNTVSCVQCMLFLPVLWNRDYFYSSGSCSDFLKFPVPVPTFRKLGKKLVFFIPKLFYKEKIDKFHQIYCKMKCTF